jgi:nucleotide-binding universal stress UspA family protein
MAKSSAKSVPCNFRVIEMFVVEMFMALARPRSTTVRSMSRATTGDRPGNLIGGYGGVELSSPAPARRGTLASGGAVVYDRGNGARRSPRRAARAGWMMKNLLAVIGDGNARPVLEASLNVARRFNSHIVGLHSLTTEYAVVFGGEMGFSISSEVDRTLEREGHERRDQARRLFRDFMTQQGVPLTPDNPAGDGPSASWREEDGRQNAVVGLIGRVYDLILVEQPEKLASIAEATLEDALFESGRPVMMVPKSAPAIIGEIVAVAWNGSTETATTVALGMPCLKQAREVVVVAVGAQHMPEPGPGGDELVRTLERHGHKVSLRTAFGRQKPQGESFLQEAMAAGADLMLKGAYTQSRIRQMIFGGATRHIIMESRIPVIMAR